MKVEKDKIISLIYELRQDDEKGEVIETLTEARPLTFLFGSGSLLKDFESNIDGLGIGDDFSFRLNSKQAYGPVNEKAIVDIPKNIFEVDGKLREDLVQIGRAVAGTAHGFAERAGDDTCTRVRAGAKEEV